MGSTKRFIKLLPKVLFSLVAVAVFAFTWRYTSLFLEEKDSAKAVLTQEQPEKITTPEPVPTQAPPPVIIQDSDPLTSCITANCGTLKIKQSACSVGVCCELEDGWSWADSKTDCRNAQNAEYERESASDEQEKTTEIGSGVRCITDAFNTYNTCMDDCLDAIKIDATLGNACMESCQKAYDDTLKICD